ncbi:MAG TPA: cytochrome c biogenesis protein CcsA [Candidatus Thermoplasmatota archaeon]|nr:cytochrome c biogenesis protein CcsA [Candidatus Thermoplasmatota archaeon]
MEPAAWTRAARATGAVAAASLAALCLLVWQAAPDWSLSTGVRAPVTRNLLFFHPPAAWASFAAYATVVVGSIAYLNERDPRHDRLARCAAEAGWVLNTVALTTGTFWGIQEWSDSGQSALATVYTEPKVLVVVVLWATFGAYLLLRRLVPSATRAARLGAAFALLGFLAVPASFVTSRVLTTSLHPDIGGPGANPDAAVEGSVGALLAFGAFAFLALFVHLLVLRLRLAHLEDKVAAAEDAAETREDAGTAPRPEAKA